MWWTLTEIVVLSLVSAAILVPTILLTLARLGLFEPIEFELFGHVWKFRPK